MSSEKSLVSVLVATVVVSSVYAFPMWKENFRVSINETGTEFSEDVEIDMIKQQVRVHVPAHNALQETASLHDFKNGHSIICYIKDGYCVLHNGQEGLDYTLSSVKWGLETLQAEDNVLSEKNSALVRKFFILEKTPLPDISFLSSEAQAFLNGRPLYRSKLFTMPPGAIVLQGIVLTPAGTKRKRALLSQVQLTFASVGTNLITGKPVLYCKNGLDKVTVWGYTTGSCEWIEVCGYGKDGHKTCSNNHYTSNTPYRCECCEGQFAKDDCICDAGGSDTSDPFA